MVSTDAINRARNALTHMKLPDWVERIDAEAMIDHTGDPALQVTVVVREGSSDALNDGAALNALVREIHGTVDAAGVDYYPYTRFLISGDADEESDGEAA